MIQIPTNARQQQAWQDAHRLRREAFAAVIHALMKKAGPREGTGRMGHDGPKISSLARSGEVLRAVR